MEPNLLHQKIENLRDILVPSLFTEKQLDVLIKRITRKKLTQPEKNYLSNAIKSKIRAVEAVKYANLGSLYHPDMSPAKLNGIIQDAYAREGMQLAGTKKTGGRIISATDAVKLAIGNYPVLDARILSLMPVFIANSISRINLYEIFYFAIENSLVNIAGYLFEVSYTLEKNPAIKTFLNALSHNRDNVPVYFDSRYKKAEKIIIHDAISRKWDIFTLNTLSDYKQYFEEYGQ